MPFNADMIKVCTHLFTNSCYTLLLLAAVTLGTTTVLYASFIIKEYFRT